MALTFPYPPSGVDTRMDYLMPITSPRQPNNRVLPTWGGSGSSLGACGCQQAASSPGALSGLGAVVINQAMLGDITIASQGDAMAAMNAVAPSWAWGVNAVLRTALTVAGGYHGYKRNGTVGSAIGYGLLATFLPTIGMVTMAVQGIAERK